MPSAVAEGIIYGTPDMGNYYRVKIPNGLGSRNR